MLHLSGNITTIFFLKMSYFMTYIKEVTLDIDTYQQVMFARGNFHYSSITVQTV